MLIYLKTGHHHLIPDPFQFVIPSHPPFRRYITYTVDKASLTTPNKRNKTAETMTEERLETLR